MMNLGGRLEGRESWQLFEASPGTSFRGVSVSSVHLPVVSFT
jgi:hypothetical protein